MNPCQSHDIQQTFLLSTQTFRDEDQHAPSLCVTILKCSYGLWCQWLGVCAALPELRAREKAGTVARDVIEYLDSIDYNKYYESVLSPAKRGGDKNKMFLEFSLNSIKAAQVPFLQSKILPQFAGVLDLPNSSLY